MHLRLLFITLFITFGLQAQIVTGKVISSSGEPIPFAKVSLKQHNVGTRTSDNGTFSIQFTQKQVKDSLIVQYLGYKTHKQLIQFSKDKSPFTIVLEEDYKLTQEVTFVGLKHYPAEEIVKNIIKKTPDNYQDEQINLKGFYREIVKEEKDWVMLNEASLDINYGKYPQKRFVNKAHSVFYDMDFRPRNIRNHSVFRHLVHFPSYINVKDDEVVVSKTRSSVDYSKYKASISSVGAFFDLLAVDKVKYQCDFLDPKLLKKYTYKNEQQDWVDTTLCYVIRFYPSKDFQKPLNFTRNGKFDNPIYVGKMYVSRNFSVIKIEYEFAENIDFSRFIFSNGRIGPPKDVKITVNYQPYEGRYILQSVSTFQTKDYSYSDLANQKANYECYRELYLGNYDKTIKKFHKDSLSYFTKSYQINDLSDFYDVNYWKEFEQNKLFKPLSKSIKKSFEQKISLEEQFKRINLKPSDIEVPIASKEYAQKVMHADTLVDHYQWIETGNEKEISQHLQSENEYFEKVTNTFKKRYNRIFQGNVNYLLVQQKKETDSLVKREKYRLSNGIEYRFEKVVDVGTVLLKKQGEQEDTLLNYSALIEGKINFFLEDLAFSKMGNLLLSYSVEGGYSNTMHVYNGNQLVFQQDSTSGAYWLNDSTIVFAKQNQQLRTNQICLLDCKQLVVKTIYTETESDYALYIEERQHYLLVDAVSLTKSKVGLINKSDKNQLYWLNQAEEGTFLEATTNQEKVYYFINKRTGQNEFIEHGANPKTLYTTDKLITQVSITKDFAVLTEAKNNSYSLTSLNLTTGKTVHFLQDDTIKFVDTEVEQDGYESNKLIVIVSSPTKPFDEFVLDLNTNVFQLESQWGLRDSNVVNVEMTTVASKDGVPIPLMVLSNTKIHQDSIKGIILKCYGSYGYPEEPRFNDEDQVYVKLGYVVAYAHVRGSGGLGYDWYNQGRRSNKINSFEDYVACAEYLKGHYKVDRSKMVGIGASAGGVRMGYVANNYPELFGTLIFDRPFLDVLTKMEDRLSVLTEAEIEEWGTSENLGEYNYIKSYSPYQNIEKKDYPNMLFLGGYYDVQTPYGQITKSVAKYRENNPSESLILLFVEMNSGHKGLASGLDVVSQKIAAFIFHTTSF